MNYLQYLRQPQYLSAVCAILSIILAFAESKFSKQKYEYKYYLKVGVIVFINVFAVLYLVKGNYIQINGISLPQKGGASGLSLSDGNNLTDVSSINPSNYASVDTGNPNF